MKSKTKIEKQTQRKTNNEVVSTIIATKKKKEWLEVAETLSRPRRKQVSLNLNEIDAAGKEGEIVVVPGKVLSEGEIKKKMKIVGLKFSEKAKEKLLKSKTQTSSIIEEIKKNPEAKGVMIVKK